jgi:hypothetical protein
VGRKRLLLAAFAERDLKRVATVAAHVGNVALAHSGVRHWWSAAMSGYAWALGEQALAPESVEA